MDTIEQEIFDQSYEDTLKRLEQLSRRPGFDIAEFEGELVHLMRYEGQDWTGRGEVKNSEISGQILAYQAFIFRWKKKHRSADD